MANSQPYRMTKLSEIKPYDRNPRIIPQAAVDAVAKSIQAFGFRQPIVVDGQGVILAGHTRYKAAQQLGLTEVPVVWQTDIDEIRAKGYRIADNKTAEISAWDRDLFDEEIQGIMQNCDFDIKDLGLAEWEIDRILSQGKDIFCSENFTAQKESPLSAFDMQTLKKQPEFSKTEVKAVDGAAKTEVKAVDGAAKSDETKYIKCPFCGGTFSNG